MKMIFKNLLFIFLFIIFFSFNFSHANITNELDKARGLINKNKFEEAYEIYSKLSNYKIPEVDHYIALFHCYDYIKKHKKKC